MEDSTSSYKSAAGTAAYGLMSLYVGNQSGQTVGIFPDPIYWWEAGAAWNAMIDYWYYTGDTTYNNEVSAALLAQIGTNDDYMPANQTLTEGNDDHGFWGLAAMNAAEKNFPNPPSDEPGWLALAQAVFNKFVSRWDTSVCDGGLRWQIYTWNKGYDYKNSISQGVFFHLGARLARYTGNTTYAEWAEKIYDWTSDIGFITSDGVIYDGAQTEENCTGITEIQWTYNSAMFIVGSAYLYNFTTEEKWKDRLDLIWGNAVNVFFENNIVYEQACEPYETCDVDDYSFKGYLVAYLGYSAAVYPDFMNTVLPYLKASAAGAAQACVGGTAGTTCGMSWLDKGYDGLTGVGQEMSALNALLSPLSKIVTAPLTSDTGGTSKGDASAGEGNSDDDDLYEIKPATVKDKVAASILTVFISMGSVSLCVFLAL